MPDPSIDERLVEAEIAVRVAKYDYDAAKRKAGNLCELHKQAFKAADLASNVYDKALKARAVLQRMKGPPHA